LYVNYGRMEKTVDFAQLLTDVIEDQAEKDNKDKVRNCKNDL